MNNLGGGEYIRGRERGREGETDGRTEVPRDCGKGSGKREGGKLEPKQRGESWRDREWAKGRERSRSRAFEGIEAASSLGSRSPCQWT